MHTILIAGAALVGLPILLHLIMKQEPKRLTFPAFRFLKQKLKTNQRKLRLRHFILLAMRMLLIALFCLTLYQPTFKSDRLNIRGEQPVAVVLVVDTTPSMGYVSNNETRLADAQRRATELLNELPEKSPVAVLDTSDESGNWLPELGAARRRIQELKETKGGKSVSSQIAVAYQLLAKVDQETEAPEPLPKLVVVFTDRTAASWEASRTEDLKKLRETFPDPKPVSVLIDFGAELPVNVGILSAEMKPQVIGTGQVATVNVSVGAVGNEQPVDVAVIAKIDGGPKGAESAPSRAVSVPPGEKRTLAFEFRDLKPGLHQVEFALERGDLLPADNTRFLTFKVGETRRILTITSDREAAAFWQAAHNSKGVFDCLVVTPEQVQLNERGAVVVRYAPDAKKPDVLVPEDIGSFEVVSLLNVENPNAVGPNPADGTLWNRLRPYLLGGGKLVVMPGPDTRVDLNGYNAGADDIMPARLTKVVRTKDLNPPEQKAASWPAPRDGRENGVTWAFDEAAFQRPMMKILDAWRQQTPNLDLIANPRMVRKFWEVEPNPAATPVVFYNDSADPKARHPAVLERAVLDKDGRAKGKVLLLTTRMDVPPVEDEWHNYWEFEQSTWFTAFPYQIALYLAGDTAEANFNYATGTVVSVPLPRGRLTRDTPVILDGPGVGTEESRPKLNDRQTDVRLGPPLTSLPGNFALSAQKGGAEVWRDGFSTNVPTEEGNLQKVPVEQIEELTGKDRVFPIDRNSTLRDWLDIALGQPIDLFPWLLIAVLMLLVLEGLVANRFYRRVRP